MAECQSNLRSAGAVSEQQAFHEAPEQHSPFSNTDTRLRPSLLERYIAASDFFTTSSTGSSSCEQVATQKLAVAFSVAFSSSWLSMSKVLRLSATSREASAPLAWR